MIGLLAALAGTLAAVAGWFVGAALGAWLGGLFGMTDFEGARGMFAAFVTGPLAGLVAMVLAVWGVLRVGRGRAALGPTLARVGIVLAAIAGVVAGGIVLRLALSGTYTNELPPRLAFELRAPAAMVLEDRAAIRVELNTDANSADALLTDVRTGGERRVVIGLVELAMKTRSRLLHPASTPAPGAWQHARWVDRQAADGRPEPAPEGDPVTLRWRVQRAGDP